MSRAVSVTGLTVGCGRNNNRDIARRRRSLPRSSTAANPRVSCSSAGRLAIALAAGLCLSGLLGSGAALGADEAATLRKALDAEKQKSAALEAELEKAREQLSNRLEALFANVTWQSDPEVALLRQKLDSAVAEIAGLNVARENTRGYATRLEKRLRRTNEKVEALEEAARAEAAQVRKQLAAKEAEIEGLKAAVAEAEAALVGAAEQVEQARVKQDVWAGRVVHANEAALVAAAGAQALREKLSGLEVKLEEVGSERDVLKVKLDEVESEIGQRIERVFAAASGETGSQVDSLREKLAAAQREIERLNAALQERRETASGNN